MTSTTAPLIEAPETVAAIAAAVRRLLDSFDAEQMARASFAFSDEDERRSWAYFPRDFHGVPLRDMSGEQRVLVGLLLEAALGMPALAKAGAIMSIENVLGLLEQHLRFERNPNLYFFSVFGTPEDDTWAFRFEGHHVSLNFSFAGGRLFAPTPVFLGSNPAVVRHGDALVLRVLGEEEDRARDLLGSLDASQAAKAIVSDEAPWDFVLRNTPRIGDVVFPGDVQVPAFLAVADERLAADKRALVRFSRAEPIGISAAAMSGDQREALVRLLRVYFDRLPDPVAAAAERRTQALGLDNVHFGWAGATQLGAGHYYRVQGPSLLIEYDNTQNDANHIHSVWRDPDGDFGGDFLRSHLAGSH